MTIATVTLLLTSLITPLFAVRTASPIQVPRGSAITLDGVIDEAEWKDAMQFKLANGGELRLKYDGSHLLVAMKGQKESEGWGHVYVTDGRDVYVLHASAALGAAIYRLGEGGNWQPTQSFKWEMRDRTQSEAALSARAAYLETNGWVASTTRMGTRGEVEFKLAKRFTRDNSTRLAVAYASDPKSPLYWPESLTDDALKPELMMGNTPAPLNFNLNTWARLKF